MIQFSVVSFHKSPGYMIKAVCKLSLNPNEKLDPAQELMDLKATLQKIIPGNMKAKYVVTHQDLTINLKADDANKSLAYVAKMKDFIKDAATTLNHRIRM